MSEKIAIFGTGYVGLVTGVCLASVGNVVTCVDIDEDKIASLQQGKCPIYEPRLQGHLKKMIKCNQLMFVLGAKKAIQDNDIIMIAVGTPPDENSNADLRYVFNVAKAIGRHINGYKVVVIKSTVPPLTGDKVEEKICQTMEECDNRSYNFDVVSNPEFLKEGNAVEDFLKPDRIVIGTNLIKARGIMESLYLPFMRSGYKVIFMDRISAELTKYAANGMLAARVSFMNEVAKIAEGYGANIEEVRLGIGLDSRIGKHFLYAGPGYGGSCFPKDISALISAAYKVDIEPILLEAVKLVNENQRHFFVEKIMKYYNFDISNKKFAVWGLSFKANTDDVRESPAIVILNSLLSERNVKICAYDPEGQKNFMLENSVGKNKNMSYYEDPYDVLPGADALIILTEWSCFRAPNLPRIKAMLNDPVIFDARNLLKPADVAKNGMGYISIGKEDAFPK